MKITASNFISLSWPCLQEEEKPLAHHEELAKKLMDDNEPQTLHQQKNMSIKGQSARYLVMQVSDACRTFTLCLGCCNYDLKSKK